MAEQTPNKPTNRRSGDRRVGPRSAPGSAMWYVLGVMLLLALGQAFFSSMYSGKSVPYSEFKTLVRDGKVQELVVAEDRIRGTLKGAGDARARAFNTVRIEDPKLIEDLEKYGVKYHG